MAKLYLVTKNKEKFIMEDSLTEIYKKTFKFKNEQDMIGKTVSKDSENYSLKIMSVVGTNVITKEPIIEEVRKIFKDDISKAKNLLKDRKFLKKLINHNPNIAPDSVKYNVQNGYSQKATTDQFVRYINSFLNQKDMKGYFEKITKILDFYDYERRRKGIYTKEELMEEMRFENDEEYDRYEKEEYLTEDEVKSQFNYDERVVPMNVESSRPTIKTNNSKIEYDRYEKEEYLTSEEEKLMYGPEEDLYMLFKSPEFEHHYGTKKTVLLDNTDYLNKDISNYISSIFDKCCVDYVYDFNYIHDENIDFITYIGEYNRGLFEKMIESGKYIMFINTSENKKTMRNDNIAVINGYNEAEIVEEIKNRYNTKKR